MGSFKDWIRSMLINVRSVDDLKEIIRGARKHDLLSEHMYQLIERLLDLEDREVGEIMVPRVDIISIEEDQTLKEAAQLYKKHGFSKIPVIGTHGDTYKGIFYIKELIRYLEEIETKKVAELTKPTHFVPESKNVIDALKEFQKERISIGLVVDEFGSVVGLVTLEDLLEEIVGEIYEEFDKEEVLLEEEEENSLVFNAKIDLEQASKILKQKGFIEDDLESEEVSTLAGFIMETYDKLPKKGERFEYGNLVFEIVDATRQRLKKIRVRRRKKDEEVQSKD